jgi:RimJ/RimL family protein N-acetyltransferase
VADWKREVDTWWAGVLGVPLDAMRAGGAHAVSLDHVGIVAIDGAEAPLGYGPANMIPVVRAAMAQADPHTLLEGDALAAALAPRAGRLLGPAWYGYATAQSLAEAGSPAVRPLGEPDLPLLARLHEQVPAAEREESGTAALPAWGYVDNGALLAVACLGSWRQMPTIGVLTHPGARRQGLATMVVTAATREGLRRRAVVQYRARCANTASISVARRSGFTHYCDALVIELRSGV